ncbi:ribosome recycling factor [Nocardia sp. XZ_19_385]|uniref:ribosome recycling factor n=1 Tax=Nocardia sp. XZ_19_385 TaxID=2769488 RepID=UPI00188F31FF|nr:ribosome recycling factor [Nocardia sp. XZ_19_385]
MINDVHKDAVLRTGEPYSAFSNAMAELLGTGPLDNILVDYYGSKVPLPEVAHVSTKGPTSSVAAFETASGDAIRQAIVRAGFRVRVSGRMIKVAALQPNPQELSAVIDEQAEQARARVRDVHRDLNDQCRTRLAEGAFSEDEERHTRSAVQRFTDEAIGHIDSAAVLYKAIATGLHPVPPDDAPDWDLLRFANTYDGYAAFDDNLIELGRAVQQTRQSWDRAGELPNDLDLLRTCLFLEAKAHRRRGLNGQPFIRALVARIRDVSDGMVSWNAL